MIILQRGYTSALIHCMYDINKTAEVHGNVESAKKKKKKAVNLVRTTGLRAINVRAIVIYIFFLFYVLVSRSATTTGTVVRRSHFYFYCARGQQRTRLVALRTRPAIATPVESNTRYHDDDDDMGTRRNRTQAACTFGFYETSACDGFEGLNRLI